jgi:hypothetical protein
LYLIMHLLQHRNLDLQQHVLRIRPCPTTFPFSSTAQSIMASGPVSGLKVLVLGFMPLRVRVFGTQNVCNFVVSNCCSLIS